MRRKTVKNQAFSGHAFSGQAFSGHAFSSHALGDESCCDATYQGIHNWYKVMFEKLGWMILAKEHGMTDRILSYRLSLERLKTSIEHKHKHMRDKDRKEDLGILLKNVHVLMEHVEKDFH